MRRLKSSKNTSANSSARKLLVGPVVLKAPGRLGRTHGSNDRILLATGSNRFSGMTLPANGSRVHVPLAFCRVDAGSKIGFAPPGKLKLPPSISGVGVVSVN